MNPTKIEQLAPEIVKALQVSLFTGYRELGRELRAAMSEQPEGGGGSSGHSSLPEKRK